MSSPDEIRIGHLIKPELLAALAQVFPLRRPLPEESERHIWIHSGNQEVLEFLQRQYDETLTQQLEA